MKSFFFRIGKMFSGISIGIAQDRLTVENFVMHLLSSGTFFFFFGSSSFYRELYSKKNHFLRFNLSPTLLILVQKKYGRYNFILS